MTDLEKIEVYLKMRLDDYIEELVTRDLCGAREIEVKTCIGLIVEMLDDFGLIADGEIRRIDISKIRS